MVIPSELSKELSVWSGLPGGFTGLEYFLTFGIIHLSSHQIYILYMLMYVQVEKVRGAGFSAA